jgi:hypothetical protein
MLAVPDLQRELPYTGLRVGRLWLDQGCALELHPPSLSSDNGVVIRFLWRPSSRALSAAAGIRGERLESRTGQERRRHEARSPFLRSF